MKCSKYSLKTVSLGIKMLHLIPVPHSVYRCVSYPAPGVQFPAEGTGVSPRHQALFPQHQVPAGQQQRCLTSACGETLLSHLHEAAARGLSPHQALLQLTGKRTGGSDDRLAKTGA